MDHRSHATSVLTYPSIAFQTAGEFRHGFTPDANHTLHQNEYRQYWGAYDFPTDFPNGVNFTIGESDEALDWVRSLADYLLKSSNDLPFHCQNYVHYSRYGPTYQRKDIVLDNVNVWTVNWQPEEAFETANKNA